MWDFSTEPEFQAHLDWMRDFVRAEVWPKMIIGNSNIDLKIGSSSDTSSIGYSSLGIALANSRFRMAMCLTLISFGQAASHSK